MSGLALFLKTNNGFQVAGAKCRSGNPSVAVSNEVAASRLIEKTAGAYKHRIEIRRQGSHLPAGLRDGNPRRPGRQKVRIRGISNDRFRSVLTNHAGAQTDACPICEFIRRDIPHFIFDAVDPLHPISLPDSAPSAQGIRS